MAPVFERGFDPGFATSTQLALSKSLTEDGTTGVRLLQFSQERDAWEAYQLIREIIEGEMLH